MNDDTRAGIEALVLIDDEGIYYAIPRETLKKYRLSDEQKAKLQHFAGEDVIGHLLWGPPMHNWSEYESLTDRYQAERREEAARERRLREHAPDRLLLE